MVPSSLLAVVIVGVGVLVEVADAAPLANDDNVAVDDRNNPILLQDDEVTVPETELLQVQVLFRHGARTPNQGSYPKDPYINYTYPPFGLGRLTKHGRQNEFSIGEWLRARYLGPDATAGTLLDEEYSFDVVRVNTSAVERTQESAAAFLAGLFPPGPSQSWTTDGTDLGSEWIPIPYHIIPVSEDRALEPLDACPARDQEMLSVHTSSAFQKRILRVLGGQDTLDYIRENSGIPGLEDPQLVGYLYSVYSVLECQKDLNMTIPDWSGRVFPEPLRSAANMFSMSLSYTPKLCRLTFGGLTSGIMFAARNHESQPKMYVYSGHDTSVTAAIQIFQLEPQDDSAFGYPEFGASILFELHRDVNSGTLGFQIFYRRNVEGPLVRMVPNGCNAFCPLDTLEGILRQADVVTTEADTCGTQSS